MGKRIIPQHEPLRVPKGWTEQARAFVIQLERIIDRIYAYVSGGFSKHDEEIETLDASQLTKPQSLTEEQKATVRANVDLNVANNLTTTAAGSVLDARQGKVLGDSVSSLHQKYFSLDTAPDIPNNSNFNSLTTPGCYRVRSYSSATTMTNIPEFTAGVLYVKNSMLEHGSVYRQQIYHTHQNKIYMRMSSDSGSTWTSWEGIALKSQLPKLTYYGHMPSSSVSDCVSNLISSMTKDGVYVFIFSWSGHPNGAVAQCARCQDTAATTKWNGIITAHDGNMYMFVKESSASTVTIRQISTTAI